MLSAKTFSACALYFAWEKNPKEPNNDDEKLSPKEAKQQTSHKHGT